MHYHDVRKGMRVAITHHEIRSSDDCFGETGVVLSSRKCWGNKRVVAIRLDNEKLYTCMFPKGPWMADSSYTAGFHIYKHWMIEPLSGEMERCLGKERKCTTTT